MVAFALVLAIFCYWSVIGFALVSRLRSRVNLLQNALLAPVTGLVATVLLVFWINLAGIPVRYGGPAVTLGLAAVAAWLFKRSSAIVPARRLLPFVAVLLLAALVTGYPILRFGFDWVSYGNDDMANYSLAAKLFLNHGHFELPDPNTVLENRDLGPLWWYYVVVGANRHGTDELLAWVASLTGLWPVQAYMSLMLSLHLVLISAAGSLIL